MDSSNGIVQSQGMAPSTSIDAVAQHGTQTPVEPQERTFRQSEVNEIVKKAKYGAVEDFKRLSYQQPDYVQQKMDHQPSQSHGFSEHDMRRLAAEEAKRLRDEWVQDAQQKSQIEAAQRIVNNYTSKVSQGKEKYQDFDKVTGDIEIRRFPNVLQILGEYVDNAHDVLYDLGKDRVKLANLENLANISPQDAIIHAQRLSQSIKDNEAAAKVRLPNEPLTQVRPSHTGTDNGAMSVKDFRRKYRV